MISSDTTARAATEPSALSAVSDCVVFALGGHTYAVAATLMRSCLSLPRLTALDETPDYLVGAFDLRGELAPVVSPAVLSGRPLQPATAGDLLVVIEAGEHPLALHADAMLGVEPTFDRPWYRDRIGTKHGVERDRTGCSSEVWLSGGQAWFIEPRAIRVVADAPMPNRSSADERLQAFERLLDARALSCLEARAERYRGLIRQHHRAQRWR